MGEELEDINQRLTGEYLRELRYFGLKYGAWIPNKNVCFNVYTLLEKLANVNTYDFLRILEKVFVNIRSEEPTVYPYPLFCQPVKAEIRDNENRYRKDADEKIVEIELRCPEGEKRVRWLISCFPQHEEFLVEPL